MTIDDPHIDIPLKEVKRRAAGVATQIMMTFNDTKWHTEENRPEKKNIE